MTAATSTTQPTDDPNHRASDSLAALALTLLVLTGVTGCGSESAAASTEPMQQSAASDRSSSRLPADPLPAWNEGPAKAAIVELVARVTRPGGPDFVPVEDRVAVFDNDGTLWVEQPIYVQGAFAFDRVRELAPRHPEWKRRSPFADVLAGDMTAVARTGERGLVEILAATHTGNTTDEFEAIVEGWIESARHPRWARPHTELVYQPMLEVLAWLRAKGFRTFIVTGGGVDFLRPWVHRVYGVLPEQTVGSRVKTKLESRDGAPVLQRLPEIDLVDDGAAKPVGIHQAIGRRPIIAFGNSDGDFEMLEWTTSAAGPNLGVIIHHTDADREWAYDRDSHVGRLDRALEEAPARGWIVVDMREDWNVVFPFEEPHPPPP